VTSLCEHAGGDEGLDRLEEIFYAKVLAAPLVRRLFSRRQPQHVEHLTWFTAESFGDRDRFTRELDAAQQNSCARSDAELHPLRHVPSRTWPGDTDA